MTVIRRLQGIATADLTSAGIAGSIRLVRCLRSAAGLTRAKTRSATNIALSALGKPQHTTERMIASTISAGLRAPGNRSTEPAWNWTLPRGQPGGYVRQHRQGFLSTGRGEADDRAGDDAA